MAGPKITTVQVQAMSVLAATHWEQLTDESRDLLLVVFDRWDVKGVSLNRELEKLANAPMVQAAKNNKGYPWKDLHLPAQLAIEAPFRFNRNNFTTEGRTIWRLPEKAQKTSSLMNILRWTDVHCQGSQPVKIISVLALCLANEHSSLANLAATCQLAMDWFGGAVWTYDISRAEYYDDELDTEKFSMEERSSERGEAFAKEPSGNSSDNLSEEKSLSTTVNLDHHKILLEQRDHVIVTRFHEETVTRSSFELQLQSIQLLGCAFYNISERLIKLDFHRVDILTFQVLKCLLGPLRKLEKVGIYACRMLHIGHTEALIGLLNEPSTTSKGKAVYLDFYPNFHAAGQNSDWTDVERLEIPSTTRSTTFRSFGASYDTFFLPLIAPYSLNIRLAVWGIVWKALPGARRLGIDLTSKGAAFRLWMERVGLEDIDGTVEIMSSCEPCARAVAEKVDREHYIDYYYDKTIGYPYDRYKTCKKCHVRMPGIFYGHLERFTADVFEQKDVECLSCHLQEYLDGEKDHNKALIHRFTSRWLRGHEDELSVAISPDACAIGLLAARRYDVFRQAWEDKQERLGLPLWPQAYHNHRFVYSDETFTRHQAGGW